MSPTTILCSADCMPGTCTAVTGAGGVYPGWWDDWVAGGVLYRYPDPSHPRVPYSVYLDAGPYLRPNKAKYEVSMRFPR